MMNIIEFKFNTFITWDWIYYTDMVHIYEYRLNILYIYGEHMFDFTSEHF